MKTEIVTLSDSEWLRKNDACTPGRVAVEKAGGLVEFWKTTGRSDWMLWLNTKIGILTPEERKAFAYKCAGAALDAAEPLRPKLKDARSIKALDVARAFLADDASRAELREAREAAFSAWRELRADAYAAYAAAAAADAEAAAYADADAAAAADAYAAAAAAYAAAYADAAADAAAYADAAAAARRRQADWLREIVSPERFAEALAKAKEL